MYCKALQHNKPRHPLKSLHSLKVHASVVGLPQMVLMWQHQVRLQRAIQV